MHSSYVTAIQRATVRMLFLATVVGVCLAMPGPTPAATSVDIAIVNNATWQIRGVYLSWTAQKNWGADQLNGNPLVPGASVTLRGVACDQTNVTVISEDQAGCFIYKAIACSGAPVVTITNDVVRDCGS